MSTHVSAAIKRHAAKAVNARDQKLRHAISLYHLSPSFYPTRASTSSASPSTSGSASARPAIDDAIDKTIYNDIWGSKDMERTAGQKGSVPTFYDGDYLLAKLNQVTRAGPRDGSYEEPTVRPILDWTNQEALGSLAPQRSPRALAYAQLKRSFLSDEVSVVKLPKSPRPELNGDEPEQTHIQPGGSAAVLRSQLDERSARVRDAFFGTVGAGEKAGLEVVRERSARHKQQQ